MSQGLTSLIKSKIFLQKLTSVKTCILYFFYILTNDYNKKLVSTYLLRCFLVTSNVIKTILALMPRMPRARMMAASVVPPGWHSNLVGLIVRFGFSGPVTPKRKLAPDIFCLLCFFLGGIIRVFSSSSENAYTAICTTQINTV